VILRLASTYQVFPDEAEHQDVNRRLLFSLPRRTHARVLDLACGSASAVAAIAESSSGCTFVGVDISHEALVSANRRLEGVLDSRQYLLLQASADQLPLSTASVNLVVMCNAIHLMSDKEQLVAEVQRVLQPNGRFAFNTPFFAGTFPSGTERFYMEWLKEALAYLERKDVKRVRKRHAPAFANRWLSSDEYQALLRNHGFVVDGVGEHTVMLTRRSFEAMGAYSELATVLLNGYPADLACHALAASAGVALEATGLQEVPRSWLEIVGVRQ
jgi:ubiquinone/menaquinone biosynthesis C-methylase UbiE